MSASLGKGQANRGKSLYTRIIIDAVVFIQNAAAKQRIDVSQSQIAQSSKENEISSNTGCVTTYQ